MHDGVDAATATHTAPVAFHLLVLLLLVSAPEEATTPHVGGGKGRGSSKGAPAGKGGVDGKGGHEAAVEDEVQVAPALGLTAPSAWR